MDQRETDHCRRSAGGGNGKCCRNFAISGVVELAICQLDGHHPDCPEHGRPRTEYEVIGDLLSEMERLTIKSETMRVVLAIMSVKTDLTGEQLMSALEKAEAHIREHGVPKE